MKKRKSPAVLLSVIALLVVSAFIFNHNKPTTSEEEALQQQQQQQAQQQANPSADAIASQVKQKAPPRAGQRPVLGKDSDKPMLATQSNSVHKPLPNETSPTPQWWK